MRGLYNTTASPSVSDVFSWVEFVGIPANFPLHFQVKKEKISGSIGRGFWLKRSRKLGSDFLLRLKRLFAPRGSSASVYFRLHRRVWGLALLVARMVPEDLLSQGLAIDVRVNLGGAYILMPQH